MTIQARYSGVCPECGERWQPGDLIRSDDHDTDCLPIWTHAACPDMPDPTTINPGEQVCPDCWLIHPLTADCDEW